MGVSEPILQVERLSWQFGGRRLVDAVSFVLLEGEARLLLGRNGAGKSALLGLLAGCRRPTQGRILWRSDLAGTKVGYLPQSPYLPERTSVLAYLAMFAVSYRVPRPLRERTIAEALELVELQDRAGWPVRELSRGETQRLELARVLLSDPRVLLLDEPLEGLDPIGAAELLGVLEELRRMGRTFLIATNRPEELTRLAETALILDAGRLVFEGTLEQLRHHLKLPQASWSEGLRAISQSQSSASLR
ncbi:MAG: ABC transporter ATP-binding protein [Candidatus Poribacteria bacterium]|nr:MAG: ABC transporter ATP-binding protein [Candidatus Poribacteria bacterium]